MTIRLMGLLTFAILCFDPEISRNLGTRANNSVYNLIFVSNIWDGSVASIV
jgi:hypothetical protein